MNFLTIILCIAYAFFLIFSDCIISRMSICLNNSTDAFVTNLISGEKCDIHRIPIIFKSRILLSFCDMVYDGLIYTEKTVLVICLHHIYRIKISYDDCSVKVKSYKYTTYNNHELFYRYDVEYCQEEAQFPVLRNVLNVYYDDKIVYRSVDTPSNKMMLAFMDPKLLFLDVQFCDGHDGIAINTRSATLNSITYKSELNHKIVQINEINNVEVISCDHEKVIYLAGNVKWAFYWAGGYIMPESTLIFELNF